MSQNLCIMSCRCPIENVVSDLGELFDNPGTAFAAATGNKHLLARVCFSLVSFYRCLVLEQSQWVESKAMVFGPDSHEKVTNRCLVRLTLTFMMGGIGEGLIMSERRPCFEQHL